MGGKYIVYTRKPRRSQTSEIVEIGGCSFFLYNTKSMTRGNCEAYMATEPYLLVKVAYSNQEAKEWLEENIDRVKVKVATADSFETITREEFVKSTRVKQKESQKGGYDNSDNREDSSCLTGC